MNIDVELNKYISLLSLDEKKLIVDFIKNLKGNNKNESISKAILSYNLELEEAVNKIKQGEFIEHDEVIKESEEW